MLTVLKIIMSSSELYLSYVQQFYSAHKTEKKKKTQEMNLVNNGNKSNWLRSHISNKAIGALCMVF